MSLRACSQVVTFKVKFTTVSKGSMQKVFKRKWAAGNSTLWSTAEFMTNVSVDEQWARSGRTGWGPAPCGRVLPAPVFPGKWCKLPVSLWAPPPPPPPPAAGLIPLLYRLSPEHRAHSGGAAAEKRRMYGREREWKRGEDTKLVCVCECVSVCECECERERQESADYRAGERPILPFLLC